MRETGRSASVQVQLQRFRENPGDALAAHRVAVALLLQARQLTREGLRLHPTVGCLRARLQVLDQLLGKQQ